MTDPSNTPMSETETPVSDALLAIHDVLKDMAQRLYSAEKSINKHRRIALDLHEAINALLTDPSINPATREAVIKKLDSVVNHIEDDIA